MTANTYGTVISATYVGRRDREEWPHHLWDVTLTRDGQTLTLPYKMGLGHEQTKCGKRHPGGGIGRYRIMPELVCRHQRCANAGWEPAPPTLYDVLGSLKADCVHGESFADWATGLGMDADSITARELYFACQTSEDRSRKFFGSDWSAICDDEDYE